MKKGGPHPDPYLHFRGIRNGGIRADGREPSSLPDHPYAAGKVAADMMALTFRNVLDLDLAVIRPFNNYGSRQNAGDYAAIIPQTARRILQGLPPILEGDGEQTRDFVFVEDTTRAFLTVYEDEASWAKW